MSSPDLPVDRAPSARPLNDPGLFVTISVVAAVAIGGLVFTMLRRPAVPAVVSLDYTKVAGGVLVPALRISEPSALAAALDSAAPGLAARVPDLMPEGYALDGGALHAVIDRPGIVAIYHNVLQDLVVWQVYRGDISELPGTTDVREHDGRRYYVHRKSTYALVFWQEGPRVQVLTSSLPAEQAVRIAFAAR
jgi:anti-sigma factor RsiW